MNEEEIIERIEDLIRTCNVGIQEHGEYDDLFQLDKTALEGILELYKIQKKQLNDAFDRGWIHKDRIKKELEELENMKVDGEVFTTSVNFAKNILQSLLEEN